MRCLNCSNELLPQDRFCALCGEKVVADPQEQLPDAQSLEQAIMAVENKGVFDDMVKQQQSPTIEFEPITQENIDNNKDREIDAVVNAVLSNPPQQEQETVQEPVQEEAPAPVQISAPMQEVNQLDYQPTAIDLPEINAVDMSMHDGSVEQKAQDDDSGYKTIASQAVIQDNISFAKQAILNAPATEKPQEPVKETAKAQEQAQAQEPAAVKPEVVFEVPKALKTVSMSRYLGYILLMAIPIVNLVVALIYAFKDDVNVNMKNLAKASLCIFAILMVVAIIALSVGVYLLATSPQSVFSFLG